MKGVRQEVMGIERARVVLYRDDLWLGVYLLALDILGALSEVTHTVEHQHSKGLEGGF